jgi:hypothetical protein
MKKFYALTAVLAVLTLAAARSYIDNRYCSLCLSRGYELLVTSPEYFSSIPSPIMSGLF